MASGHQLLRPKPKGKVGLVRPALGLDSVAGGGMRPGMMENREASGRPGPERGWRRTWSRLDPNLALVAPIWPLGVAPPIPVAQLQVTPSGLLYVSPFPG